MRGIVLGLLLTALCLGCLNPERPSAINPSRVEQHYQNVVIKFPNPSLMPIADPQTAWEIVVDVIGDYFKIEREEPMRLIGNELTDGRIDTVPAVSPTLLEPWRRETSLFEDRIENSLQTMRRRAVVHVKKINPNEVGFWVEVAVYKELEDIVPEHSTAGAATFRYDSSFSRVENPIGANKTQEGWIAKGRDLALEQEILEHILTRCNDVGAMARPSPQQPQGF